MTPDPIPLEAHHEAIRACTGCVLHATRKQAIVGEGNPRAKLMLITEAPAQQEDEQGVPLVGRSGQYLNSLLALAKIPREQVFITNLIKCRPPNNRDPLPAEIEACSPHLSQQIALIDPAVIVLMGRYSMARYFPNAQISEIHGKPKYEGSRAYYPLYHPAAVLRNPHLRLDMEADVRRLASVLATVERHRLHGEPLPVTQTPPSKPVPQQLSLF